MPDLLVVMRGMRCFVLLSGLGLFGCASFPRVTLPPIAPPADSHFLAGAGGVRLYTEVEGDARRGLVWFVLGPEISSKRVNPLLRAALHEAGFATAVLHPRGTGYSEGLRGDLDDYTLFLGDQRQFLQTLWERYPQRPLFLFGHSAGGAFALELAAKAQGPIAGVVLVNPAYKLIYSEQMGPSACDYVVYATNFLFRPAALTIDMNSKPSAVAFAADRLEGESLQADPLVVRYFSLRYLLAQSKVMGRSALNAAATPAPLLLIEGAHDVLVDPSGNDEILAARKGADREKRVAPEGGHGSSASETMVEPILEWISRRTRER